MQIKSTLLIRKMKKIFVMVLMLACTLSMTACGNSKKEETVSKQEIQVETEDKSIPNVAEDEEIKEEISGIQDDGKGEENSGLNDDGIGYDPYHGEGIGEVIALTPEEESYMLAQTTNTWLEMSKQDKDDLVVLIGRTLEAAHNYIVADYDELVMMLDNQMEKYYRNGVNESVLETVHGIYGISDGERPSGVHDDGKGEKISGLNDDGRGYDPSYGEGIGEVLALTPEEESYMLAQTTNTWLEMSQQDKDDLVVLIGRTLEAANNFIVPDYDELVMMLDNQTEKYFRNGVNESVLDTVRSIYRIY